MSDCRSEDKGSSPFRVAWLQHLALIMRLGLSIFQDGSAGRAAASYAAGHGIVPYSWDFGAEWTGAAPARAMTPSYIWVK